MEKSNKKLANTLLYYVIGLCLAVVIAVTLMTASSKKNPPVTDSSESVTETSTSRSIYGTENPASTTEKKTETDTSHRESDTVAKEESTKDAPTKPTVSDQKETYSAPVNGYVSKEYTVDVPVYSVTMNDYRAHTGVDFVVEEGAAVASCASGVVRSVYNDPMMGTTVVIEHADGISTYYMNLSESLPPDISIGASVSKGQLLGAVGSSAIIEIAQEPHLHLEMTAAGAYIDPLSVIDMSTVTVMSDQAFE